jgi:hypothetical protein
VTFPSVSTCTVYTTVADAASCCAGLAERTPADQQLIVQAASDLLYEVTGRQFRGLCQTTAHACPECSCGFGPVFVTSFWGWIWPPGVAGGTCRCGPYPVIDLGDDPVTSVDEVTYAGTAIDPSLYRVDRYRYLVRLDDPDGTNPGWPRPARETAQPGADGELLVTWTHGVPAPPLVVLAARDLACELAKSCGGDECALPPGTTTVSSQGVSINLEGLANVIAAGGHTGVRTVDLAVEAYNPKGWRVQPRIIDPGDAP